MYIKKNTLSHAVAVLLLSVATGTAMAADEYTMTDQRFDFRDISGTVSEGVGHNDVQASINFTDGTGTLTTTTDFNGELWNADVSDIKFYDGGGAAGAQSQIYSWDVETYWTGSAAITCIVTPTIDNCTDEVAAGYVHMGTSGQSISYELTEGQFALETLFDWSVNKDIPVVSIMEITNIAANGDITVASVDGVDNTLVSAPLNDAGEPTSFTELYGVEMPNCAGCGPFPGQTPVFNGVFNLVTSDNPITAQSVIVTDEDTQITLTESNYTISSTAFPSRVYRQGSKTLTASTGTGYTVSSSSTIVPDLNHDTTLTVPVQLQISSYLSAAFNTTVGINAQNDAPIVSSCSFPASAAYTASYSGTISASDPDTGDSIASYSITSDNALPTGISFDTATGELSGQSTIAQLGYVTTNIVISATDTDGPLSTSCPSFNLTVTGANDAPVLSGTPVTVVNEDAGYAFTVSAADDDAGDSLTYSISGNPAWMSISPTASGQPDGTVATISGIPTNGDVGTTGTITVTATDSVGASDQIQFTVTVINTNDAPIITAGSCVAASVEANSAYSCTPVASDDDGDALTFSASGLPASGSLSIDSTTGNISGTPTNTDAGVHNIAISVSDSTETVALASYALTVNLYDNPPVVKNGLFKIPADTVYSGTLVDLATDPENCGCVTFRQQPASGNTSFGAVTVNANGTFTYTPDAGYNGTDTFSFIASDASRDSAKATVQLIVGATTGETYAGSNFTMFDASGANANGGTNDVIATWDGLFNTDESDADFTHMTLSSITPYFGELWTAHHIRVFGPGTYTFDTTCTVAELEAGMGGPGQSCDNPLNPGQVEQFITMTVADGQVGAHILFDWSTNLNIDVLNVWNVNSEFDVSTNPGTGVLYNGEGYGAFPWSGAPAADTVWRLASTDNDGDGIPGIPMVDGAFIDFNANFNLDIVSTGSNFTMFDAGGANANGGTNDVVASWDGLFNTDESDTDFTHMTLSSITPYFGELWTAHHIRVFGPGTYTFDTTCTVAELEAGMGGPGQSCDNPLNPGQVEQFITMTVADGQVGAHILFDWSTNLNIDVLNVWNVNSAFDISTNPGTGVIYNGEGYGPYPWSGAPSADTSWRLASTDNDGDGIPGIPMVDGAFIDFNANFNLFVGSGEICVPALDNNFCGTIESNTEVADPDLGGGSAYGLAVLSLIWLVSGFYWRQIKI